MQSRRDVQGVDQRDVQGVVGSVRPSRKKSVLKKAEL